jgi:hypothetical protein
MACLSHRVAEQSNKLALALWIRHGLHDSWTAGGLGEKLVSMQLVLRDEGGEKPPCIVRMQEEAPLTGAWWSVSLPRIAENILTSPILGGKQ